MGIHGADPGAVGRIGKDDEAGAEVLCAGIYDMLPLC